MNCIPGTKGKKPLLTLGLAGKLSRSSLGRLPHWSLVDERNATVIGDAAAVAVIEPVVVNTSRGRIMAPSQATPRRRERSSSFTLHLPPAERGLGGAR
jgi:hypothetical protein